ncbi:MAG: cell division protein FtsZ [Chloroflexi bacterium]|nr:cell division protein FtsZ [Chloroflexota bacterium]MCY3939111.1 cell division protein FtsZ [Chloroflexota bacterium]
MPEKRGAPFDPRRLGDRRRPENVVGKMFRGDHVAREGFTEIRVFGVGGAGNNAINRMVDAGLSGVDFVAVNSDAQDLARCSATHKVAIGDRTVRRLGAGGDPTLGERAAMESQSDLEVAVAGAEMVFVTAGMGGGTGTGAAPVIAELAMEAGALTVAIVTTPFMFEGSRRRANAEMGVEALAANVDAIVVVNNDRLLGTVHRKTTMADAFVQADAMLLSGVRGVTDLITNVGLVNVDFADIRSIVKNAGSALLGVGSASGESRATTALEEAIRSPLIETTLDGAAAILVNITAGEDLGIHEVEAVVKGLSETAHPDARIVFGAVVDPRPTQTLTVTLIATGLSGPRTRPVLGAPRPVAASSRPERAPRQEPLPEPAPAAPEPAPAAPPETDRAPAPAPQVAPEPVMRRLDTRNPVDSNDVRVPAFIRRRLRT